MAENANDSSISLPTDLSTAPIEKDDNHNTQKRSKRNEYVSKAWYQHSNTFLFRIVLIRGSA